MTDNVESNRPRNVLDFLFRTLAPSKEDELYDALEDATDKQLESVLAAYGEHAKRGTFKAPVRELRHFRPYLPNDQRLPAWALGGIRLDSQSLGTQDGLWSAADAIKLSLLYCDSVAVDDLLGPLLSVTVSRLRLGQDDARVGLLNYVQFLLHMHDHLDSSALCLLPPAFYETGVLENTTWSKRHCFKQNLLAATAGSNLRTSLDLKELIARAPEEVRQQWVQLLATGGDAESLLRETLFDVACERTSIAYTTAEREGGNLSPYLFTYDVQLLSAIDPQSLLGNSVQLKDYHNRLLSQLMSIELSGIGRVSAEELADVRKGSEEFALIRATIEAVVEKVQALPQDLQNRDREAQRIAREQFAAAKSRFDERTNQSARLKGLKRGVFSLTSGSASALLLFLFTPSPVKAVLLAGLAQAGVAATVQGILEAIDNHPDMSSATKAAKSLYVAFSAEAGTETTLE